MACLGDLTVVDLFVTVLLPLSPRFTFRVSIRFVRSTAVLPASLPDRFERTSLFLRTVLLVLAVLLSRLVIALLFLAELLPLPLVTVLFERTLRFSLTATRLSFLYTEALSRRVLLYLCVLPMVA